MSKFCENWIEAALRIRLNEYQSRYKEFDVERFIEEVKKWKPKKQRWSPYMDNKDLAMENKKRRKRENFNRFVESQ